MMLFFNKLNLKELPQWIKPSAVLHMVLVYICRKNLPRHLVDLSIKLVLSVLNLNVSISQLLVLIPIELKELLELVLYPNYM